jgi:DNA repair protein RecO
MAYATYTTTAIVCGSKTVNTADRAYLLLTKDSGMLWANARSVREESSKQRYAMQDFSHVKISLVKGKSGWRVGSVESLKNYFFSATDREARASVQRVVKLIRRFMHGEEAVPEVFSDVVAALAAAAGGQSNVDEIFELRLLYILGYIKSEPAYAPLLERELTTHADTLLPSAARAAIKHAQTVSHL